ncbi:hypothetical protein [uncultured Ruegeria sp.]|uniref:DUF6941 family protein n=1 Tax=uncultured Ruegeria sp. TaxID=259304 RepID=UPI002612E3AE|nr:hypothetical protein [uncultured Ruegeria sp.]
MNSEAYGTTLFCDDIRNENNGKLILVGCYTNEMNFSGPAPGMLPTFAALVNLRVPRDVEFSKIKLVVVKQLTSEREEIFKTEIEVTKEQREQAFSAVEHEKPEDQILAMTFPLSWTPLPIKEEGLIKVRAYLDDKIKLRLGALKINFPKADIEAESAAQT